MQNALNGPSLLLLFDLVPKKNFDDNLRDFGSPNIPKTTTTAAFFSGKEKQFMGIA